MVVSHIPRTRPCPSDIHPIARPDRRVEDEMDGRAPAVIVEDLQRRPDLSRPPAHRFQAKSFAN